MTKDDNQTGNSAMGTGFGDAQYLARESQTEDASSMPVCESCFVGVYNACFGGNGFIFINNVSILKANIISNLPN